MSKKHSRALLAGAVLTAVLIAFFNQPFAAAAKDKAKDAAKDKKADKPAAVSKEESSKEENNKEESGKEDKDISLPVYAPSAYWIGVRVVPVPEILLSHFGVKDEGTSLAVVENVVEKSPADKAGVKRGDVIIQFGDKSINTLDDLVEQVAKIKNTAQKLIVYRDGKKTELTLTPEERPKEAFAGHIGGLTPPALKKMPQPNWEQVPGMRLGPEVWLGNQDPRKMMKQMEEYFRQMQGGDDSSQFVPIPDDENGIEEDTVKQWQVITKTDKDGKQKIQVRQTIKVENGTQEKVWETNSFDELPKEIQREIKGLQGK